VTFSFTGFPNASGNTVSERVKLDGKTVATQTFTFNGPSGSNTIKITVPPGRHKLDANARWHSNGVKGGMDRHLAHGITCEAPLEPNYSVEKLQEIAGSGLGYTKSTLTGKIGQTVDYEILVKNTGNVTLTFSALKDEKCEKIEGGPSKALAPGESATYTCVHTLTSTGSYTNEATSCASAPRVGSECKPSNKVTVEVPEAPPTCAKNSIASNFNGTAIPGGDWIWFNSSFTPSGTSAGATIKFTGQTITIVKHNKQVVTLSVPNSTVTFSTSATKATLTFTGGEWVEVVPAKFTGEVFLAGLAYQLPSELEGGAAPVTWEGNFTTSSSKVELQWQWGAAAYAEFTNEYNALEVKPLHSSNGEDNYPNGDQPGTPEHYANAIGGARGGGAANRTGSWSGKGSCK
jgi:hypothetical protein